MKLRVRLIGKRRCQGCHRRGRTSNAFTNGKGWRELCDLCAEAPLVPVALGVARPAPALRQLTAIAR